ncbi:MAG TPA: hypothetical protein VLX68_09495 [Chitinivibrionales bacterium]|nr:hypothetical protein [Chitinivibrionales bacterium]
MKKPVILFCILCLISCLLSNCGKTISPTEGKHRSQDIPANVVASDTLTSGVVQITWDSVAGARGYLVFRAKGMSDSFLPISPEVAGRLYLDSTAVPDTAYFYRVCSVLSSGDTSLPSAPDMGEARLDTTTYIPAFSASDGAYADRVALSWRRPFAHTTVIAASSDSTGTVWTPICTTSTATGCSDSLVTPGPHRYRLAVISDSAAGTLYYYDNGYRLVTDKEFFIEMNKTVKHSEAKLTKLGSLGSEQVQGDTTGTLTYNAMMKGLSLVNVTIDYVDYRDFYLTLNGRQATAITNVLNQSGIVTDTVYVTGIYPGAVVYNINVSNGAPVSGTYTVIQQGRPPGVIQFADVEQYVL